MASNPACLRVGPQARDSFGIDGWSLGISLRGEMQGCPALAPRFECMALAWLGKRCGKVSMLVQC